MLELCIQTMDEINLLKNYNLTLAEAHRREHPVVSAVDEESLLQTTNAKKNNIKLTAYIAIGAISLFLILVLVFEPFSAMQKEQIVSIEKRPIEIETVAEPTPEYIQIEVLQFGEELVSVAPDVTQTKNVDINSQSTPTPKEVPTGTPAVKPAEANTTKAAAQSSTPAKADSKNISTPIYSLQVSGLNEAEYKIFKDAAKTNSLKMEYKILNSSDNIVWSVYAVQEGTGVYIENSEVKFLSSFNNKDEAIAYATNNINGSKALIKQERQNQSSYSVNLCCTNLENAKKIAQKSGIGNKLINIVREK